MQLEISSRGGIEGPILRQQHAEQRLIGFRQRFQHRAFVAFPFGRKAADRIGCGCGCSSGKGGGDGGCRAGIRFLERRGEKTVENFSAAVAGAGTDGEGINGSHDSVWGRRWGRYATTNQRSGRTPLNPAGPAPSDRVARRLPGNTRLPPPRPPGHSRCPD